jgi:manganese-dependent ADP-ribose/CDP-alcohol diphosphatase
MVLPLIPAETKKKIAVLSKQEEWISELINQGLLLEAIPKAFGGTGSDDIVKIGWAVPKGSYQTFLKSEFTRPAPPIGLIADVQYANEPDGTNFAKTHTRRFRGALTVGLQSACAKWKELNVATVVQLGDIIDGAAKHTSSTEALNEVLKPLSAFPNVHHLVGNHDLYNFSKHELDARLNVKYHSVQVASDPRYKFIFLDPYEISVLGVSEGSEAYEEGVKTLLANHPRDFRVDKDWLREIYSLSRRFVAYNGGVSETQLTWLNNELEQCVMSKQFAILFTHIPIKPGSTCASCLVWNYDQILNVCAQFSCSKWEGKAGLVAVFAGHEHRGGFAVDETGVAHVTLSSPLEAKDNIAFAALTLGSEGMELQGFGTVETRAIPFYKTVEEARLAYEEYCEKEISDFFAACKEQGLSDKTFADCEEMYTKNEGNWDELPKGWPRKFLVKE